KIQATYTNEDARCSAIYKLFKRASKAIAAQHLIDLIEQRFEDRSLDAETLRVMLPTYVVHAISSATGGATLTTTSPTLPTPVPVAPNPGSAESLEEVAK